MVSCRVLREPGSVLAGKQRILEDEELGVFEEGEDVHSQGIHTGKNMQVPITVLRVLHHLELGKLGCAM